MSRIDISHLNPQQRKAVEETERPLLILAGAGSGKTGVITHRVAHLISTLQVSPRKILALTFTNKAANEMKERVRALLPGQTRGITITTFHSLCVRILREYIHLLGYHNDFVIFDTTSQMATIKTIFDDEDIDKEAFNLKATFFEIMKAKGEGKGPDHFLCQKSDFYAQTLGLIYQEYNKTLKSCNVIDFEDILYLTLDLFTQHADEVAPIKERYEYVMVDEYQDTNRVQYTLVKHLTERHKKICVVGDDDQSIYGWRGADIRNILDFQKDFPDSEIIKMEQNYRSTNVILDAANSVISHNSQRMSKDLWTSVQDGEKIKVILERTPRDELIEVVNHMKSYKYRTGDSWSNMSFLYRSNFQSRAVEEALRDEGIPYQLVGGTKFFDRKEIQDCLAYMRFLHNTKDEVSLLRVVNYPRRDLGKATIAALTSARIERGLSLFQMMERADELEELKGRAKNSIKAFVNMIHLYKEELKTSTFHEVFQRLFEHIRMKDEIERTEKNEQTRENKVNNYYEFINTIFLYGDRRAKKGKEANLNTFLEYVSLFTDSDTHDETAEKVSLFTVHSSKGLEFNYVAIVGLTDGQFPSKKAMEDEGRGDGLEEERRLFYVAITRAKKVLTLSYSKTRMMYGEWMHNLPSRFIEEIEQDLLETSDFDPSNSFEKEEKRQNARANFFKKYKKLRY